MNIDIRFLYYYCSLKKMMLKKILAAIGFGTAAAASAQSENGPYQDESTNLIYNLLFCDQLNLFKENHEGDLNEPWASLFSDNVDIDAITKIAKDEDQESRVRALAYGLLRRAEVDVPKGELLGTIIEVRLPQGLDTLAVFVDGRVRYINQSGKMAIIEEVPESFRAEIDEVIRSSRPIVEAIGPWDKDRLPAPQKGNVRMTFLVSDGLYFGEGPMDAVMQDQMAAPLLQAATALLVKLVDETTGSEQDAAPNP